MLKKTDLVVALSKVSNEDKDLVGEKAASLGEMIKLGFPFPDGFVITQNAYHQFALKHNLPDKLIKEIFRAYKRLESPLKDATVEILLSNILIQKKETAKGEAILVEKIKSIWLKNPSSIVICKIPQTSNIGVMFTIDPKHNNKTKIVINEGKTENHYEVLKKELKISSKIINRGKVQRLTDKQIINVAALGKKLQEYCYFPQEICFAIENSKVYITNIKPITSLKHEINHNHPKRFIHSALVKGKPLYPGIATGHLRIIQSMQDINKILRGEVIVIPYQDMIKHSLIKAGAIVVTDNRYHYIPHLQLGAFFSGKPTVVIKPNAISVLKNGAVVTVNGKNGEVYLGSKWQQ